MRGLGQSVKRSAAELQSRCIINTESLLLVHICYIYYTYTTQYTESHTHRLSTLNPCCRWQCVKHVEQYIYTTICTIHIYHTYYTYIAYITHILHTLHILHIFSTIRRVKCTQIIIPAVDENAWNIFNTIMQLSNTIYS